MKKFRDYFQSPNLVLKLIKKTKGGSWKALSKIYQIHNYYVAKIAEGYIGRGISFGELVRLGNIGLMRAVRNWKKENQYTFKSYAQFFIRQSMLQGLARRGCDWKGWPSNLN